MTVIADRGLFIRVPTASGKVQSGEAEALADAMDAATRNPDTKADASEVRTELAAVRADIALLSQRMDDRFTPMNERFEAQANKLLVRVGAVGAALAGLLFAALRYTGH